MSKNESLSKKIIKYLEDNDELVMKYHKISGVVNIYDMVPDIIDRIHSFPKLLQDYTLPTLLREALKYAINEEQDICDGIYHVASQDFDCYNTVQMYFKEVGKIYRENDDDFDIEYCEENKDLLIKMNLKSVIAVAKQYQGMGLEMADLISAGNLGLCKAWEKFKPSKINLAAVIKDELPDEDVLLGEEVMRVIMRYITYGKALERAQNKFKPEKLYNITSIHKWLDNNIKTARFSSVAVMWIRAYILAEIDQHSRLVRKPKADIYKDRERYGAYIRESTVDIDQPVNLENGITIGDTLGLEDETVNNIDINDSYNIYKENMRKLLKGVNSRDKAILLKRFGIGLPRAMTPKEIGMQENLTISRVCQLFQNALNKVRKNAVEMGISADEMFEACSQFK